MIVQGMVKYHTGPGHRLGLVEAIGHTAAQATREALHSNGVSVRMRFQMRRSHPTRFITNDCADGSCLAPMAVREARATMGSLCSIGPPRVGCKVALH